MAILDLAEDVCRRIVEWNRHRRHRYLSSTQADWPLVYTPEHVADAQDVRAAPSPSTRSVKRRRIMYGAALLGGPLLAALLWWQPTMLTGWTRAASSPVEQSAATAIDASLLGDEPLQPGSLVTVSAADPALESDSMPSAAGTPLRVPPPAPAVLVRQVDPVYPSEARAAGVQGLVVITYEVDRSGRPHNLKVVRSVPMLDEAASSALRQWRYTPPPPGSDQVYRMHAEFVLDGIVW